MPRYDYRCVDCGHGFELVQSFSEAGNGVCPECSGAGRRVFHAVPVIYKGSGFYTTDYGRAKSPGENNKEESGSNKNGGESDKPAADTKSKSETTSSASTSESSSSNSETASTTSSTDSKSGAGDK